MMVDGLSSSSGGNFPVLFENSVSEDDNPSWDPTIAGTLGRGRTWSGGKVIIVTNDGSVTTEKVADKNSVSPLKPLGRSDKNIFERVNIPGVLDVEGGGGARRR